MKVAQSKPTISAPQKTFRAFVGGLSPGTVFCHSEFPGSRWIRLADSRFANLETGFTWSIDLGWLESPMTDVTHLEALPNAILFDSDPR